MSDTKYAFPQFAFYDRTGIRANLEKQAEKGWILEEIGQFCWKFARTYPRKLHYTVVYFPKADLFDPEPGEQEQTFRDFCAHGGWTLAGASAQMQIFWSEAENPVPIETDPAIEVENIHKSMKKGMLMAYWLLVVNCLIQFVNQGLVMSNGMVKYLSSGMNLWLISTWIVMFVLAVGRIAMYYGWRAKAKRAAERDGVFVETRSIMWAENLAAFLIFGGMIFMILTLEDRRKAAVLGFCFALAFVIIILVELFRRLMKHMGFDAADSKKYTLIVSIVLTLVLCFIAIPVVTGHVLNSDDYEQKQVEDLALDIRDLLGEDAADHRTMMLANQKSPFLGYWRIHQYPGGTYMNPNLEYNLVEVKADFLYEMSLEEMMTIPRYMTDGAFLPIDPALWGADRGWQLHDGDELRKWYVLCYEDYILEILPSWDMTAEQMATVGEIFG